MNLYFATRLLATAFLSLSALAADEADEEVRTGTIIGIDLGTTYSCVGVFHNGRVEIIANDQGNRITPSYVAFTDEGRLVGDAAKHQATVNPENTVFDVKRLIGRQYKDKSVQADKKLMPYDIIPVEGKPYVQVKQGADGTMAQFAPEEVSAMILIKMKQTAEIFLGRKVDRAVVTVPAYFNDAQRHATRDAGVIAGLHVERIINEPTAAAIAYGMDKKGDESSILVFDLGGGTFDVTVLLIDNGAFQVLATNGDTHLGGEDFDQCVMMYFVELMKAKSDVDISKNKRALQVLRKEVERAKRALSTQYQTRLDVEELVSGYDFSETLTRAKFEELNNDLFRKTLGPVKKVMEDALMDIGEIDEIVLVGGSTRIPKVQQLISEFFEGKEPNTGINPDEAVAYGAAIQGSVLSGEGGDAVKDVVLLDVTPLSLGTETKGGVMAILIPRGTTIPTEKSRNFVTIDDNQKRMIIDVYEGERSRVKDNHQLGLFEMTDIPQAPRGEVEVRITYKVDANGMLEVTAEVLGTKNEKTVTIEPESGRLSQQDIDRMVEEAEKFAEEDEQARERIEARNRLESLAYELQSKLEESLSESVTPAQKKKLTDAIDEAMEFLSSNEDADKDDFDSMTSELEKISRPMFRPVDDASDEADMDDEL